VYLNDTEVLFPFRIAPGLRDLRGLRWRRLVDQACSAPEGSIDQLGFSLMLIRLNGCMTCHANSYRAMRGCTICASQAVKRYKGRDGQLTALFRAARADVEAFLVRGKPVREAIESLRLEAVDEGRQVGASVG
jgi:hypothetical protein